MDHRPFISVFFHEGTDEFLEFSRVSCGYGVDGTLDYLVDKPKQVASTEGMLKRA